MKHGNGINQITHLLHIYKSKLQVIHWFSFSNVADIVNDKQFSYSYCTNLQVVYALYLISQALAFVMFSVMDQASQLDILLVAVTPLLQFFVLVPTSCTQEQSNLMFIPTMRNFIIYSTMCWLYSVSNLLVIQYLETLYLGGNNVKVVCKRV